MTTRDKWILLGMTALVGIGKIVYPDPSPPPQPPPFMEYKGHGLWGPVHPPQRYAPEPEPRLTTEQLRNRYCFDTSIPLAEQLYRIRDSEFCN